MGFGNVFATFVFIIIVLFVVYLGHTSEMARVDIISNALGDMHEVRIEQINTDIEIIGIDASTPAQHTLIIANISNTGSNRILHSNFKYMDVFVQYNNNIFTRVTHTTNSPMGNEWQVMRILPDTRNPRIFDPDETMEIKIKITPLMTAGTSGWLKIVTPNAISDSKYFTVP